MTIEQALKIKQNWTAEQAWNDLERLLLRDERHANKVIALACKALEKQIPEIPVIDALKGSILNAKRIKSKCWSIEIYKLEDALDLINRQKVKIEGLTAKILVKAYIHSCEECEKGGAE